MTSPPVAVLVIRTSAGVEVPTVTSSLEAVLVIRTSPVEMDSGALVVLVYWGDWPKKRGVLNSEPDVTPGAEVMTVTGGQVGQSWVAVRTSLEPVDVPGTTGKQVGHSLVMVSIEVGGQVVVTGGQVGQSCVTVSTEADPVVVTGGQVGHGWLTIVT